MKNIIIYGASGHSKVVIEIVESLAFNILNIIDDNPKVKDILKYPVDNNVEISKEAFWFISIGNNFIRKKIVEKINKNYITLIHPSATVSKRCQINNGSVVMSGVSINVDAQIGQHCIINTNASIDHECIIEDFVHISPNVALAGNVFVGEGTHIGIGTSIIQGIKIGKWCTIGAGSVVIRDVPDGATVVGNPSRVIKIKSDIG